MNKKIFAATVALGSLVFVGGTQANAAPTTQTHMETETGISFYGGNIPNPGPFEGELSLAYVPGRFDFGTNEVTDASKYVQTYYQKNTDVNKYIAVSDDRGTSKASWKLSASLAEFKDAANEAGLANAVISFTTADLNAYGMKPADSDAKKTPTPPISQDGVLTDLSEANKAMFTRTKDVSLTAGANTATEVLKFAAPDQQTDKNALIVATQVSDVKLKVLDHSGVTDKTFTSKISWDLADDVNPTPTPAP